MTILYVLVLRVGDDFQLCGAYRQEADAVAHLELAALLHDTRHYEIRVCPFSNKEA